MQGRVLIVAGSDSGGGAGIQADIKAVTALDGYAATALTALTAQNSLGVRGVETVSPSFIEAQMVTVLDDIGADCVKIGMLVEAQVIEMVVATLEAHSADLPLVVDPVMVAKGGASLLHPDAVDVLKTKLLPRAALATPNIPEAEALLGEKIDGSEAMKDSARALLDLGPTAVLLKGGHMAGDTIKDVLVGPHGVREFHCQRFDTPHTHGTGCTLASAIAVGLAQGLALEPAVARAWAYVQEAIATAPGYGAGHGPLNHAHTVTPFMVP